MGGTLLQKQGNEWVVSKEFWHYRVRIDRIISEHPWFYAIATQ